MAQDTVIIPVRGQRTERVSGRFFTVISCTAKFTVELDGRIRREVRAGSKIGGEEFKRISFIETEGLANTVVYDAGDSEYQGEIQVSGLSENTFDEPYSMDVSGSTKDLTTSEFVNLPLVISISGINYTRKSFHLVNRDGSNDIGVHHMDGRLMDVLNGTQERTFNFAMDVKIRAIGGGVKYAIYYTLYKTTPEQ